MIVSNEPLVGAMPSKKWCSLSFLVSNSESEAWLYNLSSIPLLIKNLWNTDIEVCSNLRYYNCRRQLPDIEFILIMKFKHGKIIMRSEMLLKNKAVHVMLEEGCCACPANSEVGISKRLWHQQWAWDSEWLILLCDASIPMLTVDNEASSKENPLSKPRKADKWGQRVAEFYILPLRPLKI